MRRVFGGWENVAGGPIGHCGTATEALRDKATKGKGGGWSAEKKETFLNSMKNDQQGNYFSKQKGLSSEDTRERIALTKGYLTQVIGDKATPRKGGSGGKSATEAIAVKRNSHGQIIFKRHFHLVIILKRHFHLQIILKISYIKSKILQ